MSFEQSYTIADVKHWYSLQELQKAKAYLNSISDLELQPDKIAALVKGTAPRPYRVEISFAADKAGNPAIEPKCSCPVQYHCKHTASVLLSALSLPRMPTVNQAVLDTLTDIIMGRRPLTDYDQRVKDFQNNGGNQIRTELQQAMTIAG